MSDSRRGAWCCEQMQDAALIGGLAKAALKPEEYYVASALFIVQKIKSNQTVLKGIQENKSVPATTDVLLRGNPWLLIFHEKWQKIVKLMYTCM